MEKLTNRLWQAMLIVLAILHISHGSSHAQINNITSRSEPETCAEALPVSLGVHTTGPINSGNGASNLCTFPISGNATHARWYTFTPAVSGNYTITSALHTSVDTRLSVHTGTCGDLTCFVSNDDVGSGSFASEVTADFDAGTTYYIEWDNRWSSLGFNWSIIFYCISPVTGGEIAGNQTVCFNAAPSPFTSVFLPTGHSGKLEYQWQISTTSPTFADIAGAASETYTHTGTITQTTWFRRLARVDCAADWSDAVASNVVEVAVNPIKQFQTRQDGDWDDSDTWEQWDGFEGVNTGDYPDKPGDCWPNEVEIRHETTLASSITLPGSLTLTHGVINTGPYALIINSTDADAIQGGSTSSYINGTLVRGVDAGNVNAYFFPVGSNPFTPVEVVFTSGGGVGAITATTTPANHPQSGSSGFEPGTALNRYWTLEASGLIYQFEFDATFHWVTPDDEDDDFNWMVSEVGKWSALGWEYPVVSERTSSSVTITDQTGFSDFLVANNPPAIPLSGWSTYLVFFMMIAIVLMRFRKPI